MRIELKCRCGAVATWDDDRGVYLRPGGEPDDKCRKYQIERRADDWQDRHQACLSDGVDVPARPDREAAIQALLAKWATRSFGQHAGYLGAPETVDLVLAASGVKVRPAYLSPEACAEVAEHMVEQRNAGVTGTQNDQGEQA